jgi:hypothetical protein
MNFLCTRHPGLACPRVSSHLSAAGNGRELYMRSVPFAPRQWGGALPSIVGINKARKIVGNSDSGPYIRNADGKITYLHLPPGNTNTPLVGGINNAGDVDLSNDSQSYYIFTADGKYKHVLTPFSDLAKVDSEENPTPHLIGGINDNQDIAGYEDGGNMFVVDSSGNLLYSQAQNGLFSPWPFPGGLANDLNTIFFADIPTRPAILSTRQAHKL